MLSVFKQRKRQIYLLIEHQLLQSFGFFCFLDQTMESVYNTQRKFEGRFHGKKVRTNQSIITS